MSRQTGFQCACAVLWPSFLMAAIATMLFFSVFDPNHILMNTWFPDMSRVGAYTIGFLGFWALGAASSLLTCFLRRAPCSVKVRREDR